MRSTLILLLLCGLSLTWQADKAMAFNCNVNATGLAFGSYDVFSPAPTDTTGTISINCNIPPQNPHAPLQAIITLSPGNSGNFGQRQMQSDSGDLLNYNLYANAAMSTIWGDGGGSSSLRTTYVTRDTPWQGTIYGRIPARQNVRAGSYRDSIVITIDY